MGGARRPSLRVDIRYPHFSLKLDGTPEHLPEVRRIVEAFAPDEALPAAMEEAQLYELKSRLSEEFFQHQPLLARLRSSLVLDEDVRVMKRVIPLRREYDLEQSSASVQLIQVKESVTQLLAGLDTAKVRECLVHIRGELSREQQVTLMDAIRQRFGMGAQPRFFSTRKNLEGQVLVEMVCFGDGIAEEW